MPFYKYLRVSYVNMGKKQAVEIPKCERKLARGIHQDSQELLNKLSAIDAQIQLLQLIGKDSQQRWI